ncbi:CPBP family intramembrane metalloprotease [Thalassotalea sp. 1_MG-2023]|uniref:CPBP family intramembrane glutamic endopeptidase n=1 Tax=Thalassotalea sp. 1_MG-2023 TaxID=3062680 RepID=UPI0026E38D57|nr:CPBP family intramembrane glutamic endopeptidase [Thalassotalea sp. 1_MG-2023]MDO6428373.1 CPBP family intramembrane metalloprotease [Thalassotalea sp. 1_MG-2023]
MTSIITQKSNTIPTKHSELSSFQYLKWFVILMIVPAILSDMIFYFLLEIESTDFRLASLKTVFMNNILVAVLSIPFIHHVYKLDPNIICVQKLPTKYITRIIIFCTFISICFTLCYQLFEIEQSNFLDGISDTALSLILGFIVVCLIAPILEEILFRGILFVGLQRSGLHISLVLLITTSIFTFIHVQYDGPQLAYIFVYGVLLGIVRYKTNNILLCIAIHMIHNMYNLFLYL